MRIKHLLNFFVATVFIGVAVGCAEKDLYDPNYGKEPVKIFWIRNTWRCVA